MESNELIVDCVSCWKEYALTWKNRPDVGPAFSALVERIENQEHRFKQRHDINDYEIVSLIGKGSFGTVFKVSRKCDGESFALKRVRLTQADHDFKERNAMVLLTGSPNIINILHAFVDDHVNYIMPLMQGHLEQVLPFLKTKAVTLYSLQLMNGLKYLEQNKIVHRDIKEKNILIDNSYNLRIADFGLSINKEENIPDLLVGTRHYLAPEVLTQGKYTSKSDIWAAGSVIFKMNKPRENMFYSRGVTREDLDLRILSARFCENKIKTVQCPRFRKMLRKIFTINPNLRISASEFICSSEFLEDLHINLGDINKQSMKDHLTRHILPIADPPNPPKLSQDKKMEVTERIMYAGFYYYSFPNEGLTIAPELAQGQQQNRLNEEVHLADDNSKLCPVTSTRMFTCKTCQKTFKYKKNLYRHRRTVHPQPYAIKCTFKYCESTFTRKDSLKSHLNSVHSKKKLHTCGGCSTKFSSRQNLHYHRKSCRAIQKN